jgi:Mrp family chromosome partitioning ATPase
MNQTTDAISIFSPLWRHKWLILAVGIAVAAGSYFYYKRQRPLYRAATQIYLGEEQTATAGSKTPSAAVSGQVAIINEIVVERVKELLRHGHKAALVRGGTVKATAAEKSVFITVTAEVHSARGAVLLVNTTAQTFIKRQQASHQRSIEQQIAISRRQLRRIEAASAASVVSKPTASKGKTPTSTSTSTSTSSGTANVLQEASLTSKINQLESSLAGTGAQQIKPAKIGTAQLLSPTPKRNAIFGFVIGLVLAAIASYVLARADRRLRSLAGVEAVFRSRVLVALPTVRRPIVSRDGRLAPSRSLLEPLRRLHTALQLGAMPEAEHNRSSRVILFTSANAGDGKSTLIADLALVQRDAGERVAVVEADFRRPVLAKILGLDGAHGLAEVLAGTVSVEDAMQRVLPTPAAAPDPVGSAAAVATSVESPSKGSLFLLAGGGPAANPPALLADERITDVLRSIAEDFDYVLIDAPSPVEVTDVVPLLKSVDGIVVVARLAHTREMSAQRLVELLENTPHGPMLGLAANCVPRRETQRYGFSSANGRVRSGWTIGR